MFLKFSVANLIFIPYKHKHAILSNVQNNDELSQISWKMYRESQFILQVARPNYLGGPVGAFPTVDQSFHLLRARATCQHDDEKIRESNLSSNKKQEEFLFGIPCSFPKTALICLSFLKFEGTREFSQLLVILYKIIRLSTQTRAGRTAACELVSVSQNVMYECSLKKFQAHVYIFFWY